MALQSIGLGTAADDGTGDTLRIGADKVNDNFLEIYTLLGNGTSLTSGISVSGATITLAGPTITGAIGGTIASATITTLATTTVNGTTLNAGTMAVAAGSLTDSSGAISFGNENLSTTGTLAAGNITVGNIISTGNSIILEGSTPDGNETTLFVTDPTGDRTITFPDATGTVVTTGDSNSVTGTMIAADTVAEANMANDAIGSAELKSLSTLLIKNSGGTTLKTVHGAGA